MEAAGVAVTTPWGSTASLRSRYKAQTEETLAWLEPVYRDLWANGDVAGMVKMVGEEAEALSAAYGFRVDTSASTFADLCCAFVKAMLSSFGVMHERLDGNPVETPPAPAPRPVVSVPQASRGDTLNKLIEDYTAESLTGRVTQSTLDDYGPVFRLLLGVLGPECQVSAIGRVEGRAIFAAMKGLPTNASKHKQLKGLSLLDMIEKGKELGLPTIGPKTVTAGYLAKANALFAWAYREERMKAIPLKGLKVHDPVAAGDKRDPFTMPQLKTLFAQAPWTPRDPTAGGRPIRYWGPLIALFHGMRLGEIAQLDVADIATVKGVPMFLIRAGGDKRVKTQNSRRSLPIHPELQRMGLLTYIEGQRKAGASKLFPGEGPNNPEKRSQWGVSLGRWFQRQIEPLKSEGKGLGVHALRHTFEDALREADLHGTPMGQQLAGRSKSGNVSGDYGSGYSTSKLLEAISSTSYPELDLSHLHVKPSDA
jgi:integrase